LLTVMLLLGLLIHLVLGLTVTLRLVRRLHELSRRDALTGLPNRRAADEQIEGLLERLRRLRSPFALLLVDADHFKRINDSQGHAIGDRALVHLGALLQRHARSVDLVARFGGEEFVLLLPDCDRDTALQVAERLRQEVVDEPLRLGARKLGLSVSVGLALAREGESAAELMGRADRALYRAKHQGRNRVEFEA
jgi:diguanylate cyclase (GGDEF)-like protein